MRHSKQSPEVNAGSMADIAFLLLIFFLVTATISSDAGINRVLPANCPTGDCESIKQERNILRIVINNNDDIMVENERINLANLKDVTKAFIDNNGDQSCLYCNGLSVKEASDNPKDAVISIQNGKQTTYKSFVAVQNEISKAYFELRSNYATKVLKKSVDQLSKEDLKQVKKAYPFILSEAETK